MSVFQAANILFPEDQDLGKWAVIACDQFTSQPEYWEEVKRISGNSPTTLKLVLPEVELQGEYKHRIPEINANMESYSQKQIFKEYPDSYIYVERTLLNGSIRRGVIGVVDLEAYSYEADAQSHIRATEQTVLERIPPRVAIRENASIELPHIILFCDDVQDRLLGCCAALKTASPLLYDFELMCGGGHIKGWLLCGKAKEAVDEAFLSYSAACEAKYSGKPAVILAVGDGNHSLATAKACYEKLKAANPGVDLTNHPARYALVEVENIQDEAQAFEPIHRVITDCHPEELLIALQEAIGSKEGHQVQWIMQEQKGSLCIDPAKGKLAVKTVQDFLDSYLKEHQGVIDYIHGEDTTESLAKPSGCLGLVLPPFSKEALFESIHAQGPLPRKTFSIGHAQEKRYYLEARKIK